MRLRSRVRWRHYRIRRVVQSLLLPCAWVVLNLSAIAVGGNQTPAFDDFVQPWRRPKDRGRVTLGLVLAELTGGSAAREDALYRSVDRKIRGRSATAWGYAAVQRDEFLWTPTIAMAALGATEFLVPITSAAELTCCPLDAGTLGSRSLTTTDTKPGLEGGFRNVSSYLIHSWQARRYADESEGAPHMEVTS